MEGTGEPPQRLHLQRRDCVDSSIGNCRFQNHEIQVERSPALASCSVNERLMRLNPLLLNCKRAGVQPNEFSCRGRDADRSTPPAQIRTCALTHTALTKDAWRQNGYCCLPHTAQSVGHAFPRSVSGTCKIERCSP